MGQPQQRVLITGLDSFTGRHLEAALTRAGYDVHGTVRAPAAAGPARHVAELRDAGALGRVVARVAPHHVIHLAAVSFVAHDDVEGIYLANVVGTRNLLAALAGPAIAAGELRTVVLASSANVYGNTDMDPIREDAPFRPANDYAASKAAMELMAAPWAERLPLTIVRPFNYTGVGQSPNFLVPKIVDAFARRSATLELGNLDVHRDFSDVRDVVGAYAGLLGVATPPSVLNICSGHTHTLREILATVAELSGHALEVRVNPRFVRANEVRVLRGSVARLAAVLPDWQPRPLRDTLAWMLENAPHDTSSPMG